MTNSQYINGVWSDGRGEALTSVDPSTGNVHWAAHASSLTDVDDAVQAAGQAAASWRTLALPEREAILRRFGEIVEERTDSLAAAISRDNGKPLWEARTEVGSLKTKIAATTAAFAERAADRSQEVNGRTSVTRFRPHGVLAVLGPFNFPMSMPNSHVMPALYAGNSVVLKPSDKTPAAAVEYVQAWVDAGLPPGVLNLVQGDAAVGRALVTHRGIDGVLFIGSHSVGMAISRDLAESPEKQLTLEMGGNAPLVVWSYDDVRVPVHIAIQSAFISSGQRCTAARRLIVNQEIADEFLDSLGRATEQIVVGQAEESDPQPFMGPMISAGAAEHYLGQIDRLRSLGARDLVESRPVADLGPAFVRPGLLEVTGVDVPDEEVFGPLLQVTVVGSFEEAIETANDTKFGLAAGLVATERDLYTEFFDKTKAGIVNWNQPITGATTMAPFGGVKASGNFRPAGFLSVDYCSYATASIEDDSPTVPDKLSPGLTY